MRSRIASAASTKALIADERRDPTASAGHGYLTRDRPCDRDAAAERRLAGRGDLPGEPSQCGGIGGDIPFAQDPSGRLRREKTVDDLVAAVEVPRSRVSSTTLASSTSKTSTALTSGAGGRRSR